MGGKGFTEAMRLYETTGRSAGRCVKCLGITALDTVGGGPKILIDGIKESFTIDDIRDSKGRRMTTEQDNQIGRRPYVREDADADRQYVFHPKDDDLFIRTGRQVIYACRLDISIEVWTQECESMYEEVSNWAAQRADRILACYAVPRGIGIGLFFVPRSESFDFDLAEELADLTSKLVRTYNVGPVEIHQIPDDEKVRFIGSNTAREVYLNAD